MRKPTNKKCSACAELDKADARKQSCWQEKACSRKRKYYQCRERELIEKKTKYALKTNKPLPQKFDLDSDGIYRAELVIYGKKPNKEGLINGGVNAIQFNIYQGKNLAFESLPMPTYGLLAADLETIIDRGMESLYENFHIKRLGRVIWQDTIPKA